MFRFPVLLALAAALFCVHGNEAQANGKAISGQTVYQAERCFRCHRQPPHREHSRDWHYVHLFYPKSVSAGSTMPPYRKGFAVLAARVSGESFLTPSGQVVLGLKPSSSLKRFVSFNRSRLIFLYLSAVSIPGIPEGLKAFAEGGDGLPVLWVPPELRGTVHPGDRVTVAFPAQRARALVSYLESMEQPQKSGWLSREKPGTRSSLSRGKDVYRKFCAGCHGDLGSGLGPASFFLFPKPRNFTSGLFKLKSTFPEDLPDDLDLFRTITRGMAGTAMPGWGFLPRADRLALVEVVKSFAVNPATGKNLFVERPHRRLLAVKEPRPDPEAFRRGKKFFSGKGKCHDCHGPGARSRDGLPHGDGPSSRVLVDDWGYPIPPPDLVKGPFKRGRSLAEIYLTVTAGMGGTPMPSYRDALSEAERWDLAAYVSGLHQGQGKKR